MKDNFTPKFHINWPGNYETTPRWDLDYTLVSVTMQLHLEFSLRGIFSIFQKFEEFFNLIDYF